jgi:SAM-dependent methyltransferase
MFLAGKMPRLRRLLAHVSYERMASEVPTATWTFMNFGFVPSDGAVPDLAPGDEADRLCIQLYHRVASAADLRGTRVLEVGSGRGGGASYLARYLGPAHVTGADFSAQAVALSRTIHAGVPNLAFAEGDAERLPFADASFDVVVNVESSHCYARMDRFLAEVARVLRPGGHFLYADFRARADIPALGQQLDAAPGLVRIAHEDITSAVVAALEAGDARKRALIDAMVRPPRVRKQVGEFAALVGSRTYGEFRNRDLIYVRYAFRRR